MKVLVTGRNGQLVQSLHERAVFHPSLHLVSAGRPDLDLERPESIAIAIAEAAPDLVINAAAFTTVDQAEDEPERAWAINARGAAAVAAAARRSGARLVQISTDYVFDGSSPVPYGENSPTGPISVYGRTKLVGEERIKAEYPDATIVRTAWVYSPFGKNFVKSMLAAALTQDRVEVVSDQHGNPSSALDIASGLLAMAEQWNQGSCAGRGEIFHLAGRGSASWFDFAVTVLEEHKRLGGRDVSVVPIGTADWPTRAKRPVNSRLDTSAFHARFGFQMPEWKSSAKAVVQRLTNFP